MNKFRHIFPIIFFLIWQLSFNSHFADCGTAHNESESRQNCCGTSECKCCCNENNETATHSENSGCSFCSDSPIETHKTTVEKISLFKHGLNVSEIRVKIKTDNYGFIKFDSIQKLPPGNKLFITNTSLLI